MAIRNTKLTVSECTGVMRAMGDATRLRILESLLVREKCVSDLVAEIRRTQPHVSHHLRILREAGLIEGMREGKRVCYRISPMIRRFLDNPRRQGFDFGCCRLSFATTSLTAHSR